MNTYTVRQVDADGQVLSEKQVVAHAYNFVLRELKDVVEGAHGIEVYDQDGERAGEVSVAYWRQKVSRR